MAIWQFKVALVPQSWIDSGGNVDSLFGEQGFEPVGAWRGYRDDRLEGCLGSVLSEGKSWHINLTLWGNAESDDIQLWRDGSEVGSIQVRFDLRNPNMSLFRAVTNVARELRLALLCLDGRRVIDSDAHKLLRAAAESDAAHFVLDPQSFLTQVGAANEKAT